MSMTPKLLTPTSQLRPQLYDHRLKAMEPGCPRNGWKYIQTQSIPSTAGCMLNRYKSWCVEFVLLLPFYAFSFLSIIFICLHSGQLPGGNARKRLNCKFKASSRCVTIVMIWGFTWNIVSTYVPESLDLFIPLRLTWRIEPQKIDG